MCQNAEPIEPIVTKFDGVTSTMPRQNRPSWGLSANNFCDSLLIRPDLIACSICPFDLLDFFAFAESYIGRESVVFQEGMGKGERRKGGEDNERK